MLFILPWGTHCTAVYYAQTGVPYIASVCIFFFSVKEAKFGPRAEAELKAPCRTPLFQFCLRK